MLSSETAGVNTLDRYLIRQTVAPFLLALGIFTFMLAIQPVLEHARNLLAKGVDLPTLGWLLTLLLPSAVGLAIPMAFLTGVLMALGRLSGDRESVAFLACGISPMRILRPVLFMASIAAGLDMYVLMRLTPQANDTWRDITFKLLVDTTSSDVRPGVFYERLKDRVLYVRETERGGHWTGVFMADMSNADQPVITLAREGTLIIEPEHERVAMMFSGVAQYRPAGADSRAYALSSVEDVRVEVSAAEMFGRGTLPGVREKTPAQLRQMIAEIRTNQARQKAEGSQVTQSAHPEIIQLQQMYAFPAACLILGAIGLALGLTTRQGGRLAGLTLGLGVILIYYALMTMAEAWTKGIWKDGGNADLAATWARWIPNIGVGLLAAFALWRQTRSSGSSWSWPGWLSGRRRRSAPAADPRSAIVVTVHAAPKPWLSMPLPRILDRYVSSRYLQVVALSFLALLALYYIGTFIDLADKLFKGQATTRAFLNYLAHQTPQFFSYVIPIAVLVGVLATVGGLSRTGELVVMRACGVSLYRTALPFFFFALIGSAFLFALEDRVLAESNRTARMLRDDIANPTNQPRKIVPSKLNWLVGEDGRIYHYTIFERASLVDGKPTLWGLSAFERTPDGLRLNAHLQAHRGTFDGSIWHLEKGWIQRFDSEPSLRAEFDSQTMSLARAEDFRRAEIDPVGMTVWQSWDYIRRLSASGYSVTDQLTNLHRKVAFPFVTVVMTLLAIPFGVTVGRKGTLYGIGLAMIVAGLYFLSMTLFVAIGAAGVLPAWLAAWGTNIIFAAGAVFLVLTVRT